LRTHLRQLDTLEAGACRIWRSSWRFLHSLLDDVKLSHRHLGCSLHLRSLLAGITKRMSDGKNVVRTPLMKLAILLMHNHRPQIVARPVAETISSIGTVASGRRLLTLILPRLCNCIAPALLDPKRQRWRQRLALEVMALLAQAWAAAVCAAIAACGSRRQDETRPDATGLFTKAVMSRLGQNGQLPRLSAEGLVEIRHPVPSSATQRPQSWRSGGGVAAEQIEDWVIAVRPAGGYGSRSSALSWSIIGDRLPWLRKDGSQRAGRLSKRANCRWEPAASEPAPAPSQEVGRAKQKPPQQQQQATRSNDRPLQHQQPRKVKRFLDQSEKPELQAGGRHRFA
uniref:CLASP_N domain-containing protein n=1 Tax=Macrostomum lignano TaxID=282301 RepID=A0A1I8F4N5_9PLAT